MMTAKRMVPARKRAASAIAPTTTWRSVSTCFCMRRYGNPVQDESSERQLNIHMDAEHLAGVYSNFANITFSDYEFTITFARIDHQVEEGDVPGVVVTRVNMSTRFMKELLDAMNDSWSKWSSREGIRNLPETSEGDRG